MREHEARQAPLQDGARRQVRPHPGLSRREDRSAAAARHPLDEAPVRHLHHRRVLDRPRPRAERRAPDRPRDRHRPQQGGGRHLGRDRRPRPPGRAEAERARSRPGAGWDGTATPATDAATTSISPGCTRRRKPRHPARVVYTRRCPGPVDTAPAPPPPPHEPARPAAPGPPAASGGSPSGGISSEQARPGRPGLLARGRGKGCPLVPPRRTASRWSGGRTQQDTVSSALLPTQPAHPAPPETSRTVRPVLESGPRALASCLARARPIRGTCPLPLKAASFRI